MTVPSLDRPSRAGLLPPGSLARPAETDLEVSRLFVRLLKEGYSVRSRAKGASMAPLIQPGDLLTVRPTTYADIQVGNVVAYGSTEDGAEHTLATHRVIGLVRRDPRPHLLTRDDATGWVGAGEQVFPEQVYGKVVSIERTECTLHLDRPLVALAAWGRIRMVRGIAAAKKQVRYILPDRFWTGLQRASRRGSLFSRPALSPGSHGAVRLDDVPSGQPFRPTTRARAPACDPYRALALDLQLEPHPDVLVERLGDQVLLIPATDRLVDMGAVYALNATGAEVWNRIAARRRIADLVQDLAAQFAVASTEVAQDLPKFLADLIAMGAVRPVGSSTDRLGSVRGHEE